ncbi:MAG: hypothetical protein R6U57_01590 [Anaerolineales bacterium]
MNHERYQKYLKEYTLEALEHANYDVSEAADYLLSKSEPGFFSKDKKEKKAALRRTRKVFDESRTRPVWIVLKSLGFDDLAKDFI